LLNKNWTNPIKSNILHVATVALLSILTYSLRSSKIYDILVWTRELRRCERMLCTENKERVRENRDTRTRDVRTEKKKRRCIERREESESVEYFGTNMMIPGMLNILDYPHS
jgi:hypothetical protein